MNHILSETNLFSSMLNRNMLVHVAVPTRIDGPLQGIFFHDGQNIWHDHQASFGRSWRLADALDFNEHQIMVVSVSCAEGLARLDEYAKFKDASLVGLRDWITRPCGGLADVYLKQVVDVLLPFAATYAPLKDTWIIVGSSMGGMASLTAMIEYPHVFTKMAGLSNAFWFSHDAFLDYVHNASLSTYHHIYLDVGTAESGLQHENAMYMSANDRVVKALVDKPLGSLKYVKVLDGQHNEEAWSQRIGSILKQLLSI